MNYIGEFKDRKNQTVRVEISTSASGEDQEITLEANGIEIAYESDSIFKPLKKSGATVNIYTDAIHTDLFTGELLSPTVKIYRNGSLFWYGYIQPNVYSQPFVNQKEVLSLECIDTLSNLENINYTYVNGSTSFATFIDITNHILDLTDPNRVIKTIFCQNSITVNNSTNVLSNLGCIERNFSDEIEDIKKCDEVLEEICKFLGLCMFQYCDAYYIVDYQHMDTGFTSFSRNGNATNKVTSLPISITRIGVGAADAKISLDGVYNKVTVVANTLKSSSPVESSGSNSGNDNTTTNLFENLVDNSETTPYETIDLWVNTQINKNDSSSFNLNTYDNVGWITGYKNDVWSKTEHNDWKHVKFLNAWFKLGSQWDLQYDGIMWGEGVGNYNIYNGVMSFDKATSRFKNSNSYDNNWAPAHRWNSNRTENDGCAVQKNFYYDVNDSVPTEYKWETYCTFPIKSSHAGLQNYMLRTKRNIAPLKGGYLVINFEFFFSNQENIAAPSLIPEYHTYYDDSISTTFYITSSDGTKYKERKIVFPTKLSIGNHYWNGKEWKEYTTLMKQQLDDGYYEIDDVQSSDQYNDVEVTYYKIWNSSWNAWQYCSKSTYDSFEGQKETETETTRKTHAVRKSGVVFSVPQSYYDDYISDRFFMAKRFNNGDNMYGTKYKLTNTASYDLNMVETADGIAIKLPEDETFSGEFLFSFSRPTRHFEALTPGGETGGSISDMIMHISDLYIKYTPANNSETSVFEKKDTNNDITYCNLIDEAFAQEYDDIRLELNTYNSEISSYSYVLDSNQQYIDEITYNNKTQKQELHIIDKYVSHFSTPKFKYSGTLHDENITPCSILHQTQLNKDLAVYKATYNILNNTVEIESVEV